MKPRSHVGIGRYRGEVLHDDAALREHFRPYPLEPGHTSILRHEPDLAHPLLQQYLPLDEAEVLSVTGCLDADGEVLALGHARKLRQWPPRLGVGTVFEEVGEQPWTAAAVHAVQQVLGRGLFELEVLVRRDDPDTFYAIDLNPRAFGQISLDIAQGRDLPRLWYGSVTGTDVTGDPPPRRRRVTQWHHAVPLFAGIAIMLTLGPDRIHHLQDLRGLAPLRSVGATRSLSDPLPSLLLGAKFLRHPGGLVRPYLRQRQGRRDVQAGL
jgi:predicted ATP-grasp superfamily ATP-dependent carboligase